MLAPLMLGTETTAQERARIEIVPYMPHADLSGVEAMAFSPDGALMVSGGRAPTARARVPKRR
jgi:hypothetical protein